MTKRDRDVEDVELVLLDQVQQQVERTLEGRQLDPKRGVLGDYRLVHYQHLGADAIVRLLAPRRPAAEHGAAASLSCEFVGESVRMREVREGRESHYRKAWGVNASERFRPRPGSTR